MIQWDKDDLEALGLLKVDVLALGMLSMIRRGAGADLPSAAASLFEMQDIPPGRPRDLRDDLRADTVGVFQIESAPR